jgi:hypothetical protein
VKIKIVSDGTPINTKVIDTETGRDLGLLVSRIDVSVGAQEMVTARLEIIGVELDIDIPKNNLEFTISSINKQVKLPKKELPYFGAENNEV